jgi:hypothetical protein
MLQNRDSTSLRFPFACLANKRRKVATTPDFINNRFSARLFVYDSADMKRWLFFAAILVVVALLGIGVWHILGKRAQQRREVAYQSALRAYSAVLRPGMTRKEVEDYLRARNIGFQQMCCVDTSQDFSKSVYDDLTKIGKEDAPWFCSEKNVYVAFQFTRPTWKAGEADAEDSDRLRAVTIHRWLEGCL